MMKVDGAQESKDDRDLTRGMPAWLLWCLPVALLIAGGAWPDGRRGYGPLPLR